MVREIYRLTDLFPNREVYVLTAQMRRAAISIPSNIAEGKKRKTKNDFLHFLRIADGSAAELETQIMIAKDLFVEIDFKRSMELLEEVQKMLITLIKKLHASNS